MSDEANVPATAAPHVDWNVAGVQTAAMNGGQWRVDVVIRGKVEGLVDRDGGADQLRFSV